MCPDGHFFSLCFSCTAYGAEIFAAGLSLEAVLCE